MKGMTLEEMNMAQHSVITVEDAVYKHIDWLIQAQYMYLPYETLYFIEGGNIWYESEDD